MEDKKKVEVLELIKTENGDFTADKIQELREENSLDRESNGRFAKGNKLAGGRRAIPPEIKQLFTSMVPEVVSKIHEIILTSDDNKLVLDAAKIVLDRVYGKPLQAVDVDAKTDTTIKIVLDGDAKEWGK